MSSGRRLLDPIECACKEQFWFDGDASDHLANCESIKPNMELTYPTLMKSFNNHRRIYDESNVLLWTLPWIIQAPINAPSKRNTEAGVFLIRLCFDIVWSRGLSSESKKTAIAAVQGNAKLRTALRTLLQQIDPSEWDEAILRMTLKV